MKSMTPVLVAACRDAADNTTDYVSTNYNFNVVCCWSAAPHGATVLAYS